MNTHSLDFRRKIVAGKQRGMSTVEVARAFGVGLSSVKCYTKTAGEGGQLRPKKNPGMLPKADERAKRLLEAALEDRSTATLAERCEYLRRVTGLRVSESTVSRLLKRLGWTRKKIGGCERAGRVLEGASPRGDLRGAAGVRRGDGLEHLAWALYA